jgi:hypothetical protein
MINHNYLTAIGLDGNFLTLSHDEQLNFLLEAMFCNKMARCPGCDSIATLILHHWFKEWNFPLTRLKKLVCISCNSILTRPRMESEGFPVPYVPPEAFESNPDTALHVLSEWPIQAAYCKKHKSNKETLFETEGTEKQEVLALMIPESLHAQITDFSQRSSIEYWAINALEQKAKRQQANRHRRVKNEGNTKTIR